MLRTNEQLVDLTDEAGEFITEMQEENDPEDAGFLYTMQCVYACLRELQAWRGAHPDERIEPVYFSDYGAHGLQ